MWALHPCRICHCEGDDESPLITPCHCTGSLRFVHQACLQQWIKSSDTRCCELCKYEFIMETKLKPLRKVRPCCVCVHVCLTIHVRFQSPPQNNKTRNVCVKTFSWSLQVQALFLGGFRDFKVKIKICVGVRIKNEPNRFKS